MTPPFVIPAVLYFVAPTMALLTFLVHDGDEATTCVAATTLVSAQATQSGDPTTKQQDQRDRSTSPTKSVNELPLIEPRQPDGDGKVKITGQLKQWHKISLTMSGPYAHEQDNQPNPFLDIRMETTFTHADGTKYVVPGYFAADGNSSETSAESGNQWRTHFAPDRNGRWNYVAAITSGERAAIIPNASSKLIFQSTGSFTIVDSNKTAPDLRAHGRLQYVGNRYLNHMGSGKYFLKAGADAPETLLGYADFDGTVAGKPKKVPLKTFSAHLQDCLLYTSPSPRDQRGSRMPSSA